MEMSNEYEPPGYEFSVITKSSFNQVLFLQEIQLSGELKAESSFDRAAKGKHFNI